MVCMVPVPVSAANVFQAVIMPIDVEVDAIVLNGVKFSQKNTVIRDLSECSDQLRQLLKCNLEDWK